MKISPNPAGFISIPEAADRLGLTRQSVGSWAARPGAPAVKTGTRVALRWPDFPRWREKELARQAALEATSGDVDAERARKLRAEAGIAELDLLARQGAVVTIADYERALGRILDRLMARLRALPVRLFHLGPEVEAAAEAEIELLVIALSRFDDDVLDEPPHAETP